MPYTVLKPFSALNKDGKAVTYHRYGTVVEDLSAATAKELVDAGKLSKGEPPEPPAVAESTPAVKPSDKPKADGGQ